MRGELIGEWVPPRSRYRSARTSGDADLCRAHNVPRNWREPADVGHRARSEPLRPTRVGLSPRADSIAPGGSSAAVAEVTGGPADPRACDGCRLASVKLAEDRDASVALAGRPASDTVPKHPLCRPRDPLVDPGPPLARVFAPSAAAVGPVVLECSVRSTFKQRDSFLQGSLCCSVSSICSRETPVPQFRPPGIEPQRGWALARGVSTTLRGLPKREPDGLVPSGSFGGERADAFSSQFARFLP